MVVRGWWRFLMSEVPLYVELRESVPARKTCGNVLVMSPWKTQLT